MRDSVARLSMTALLAIAAGCGDTSSNNTRSAEGGKKSLLDAAMSSQRFAPAAGSEQTSSPAAVNTSRGPATQRTRPTAKNIGGIMDTGSTLSETGFGGGGPSGPVTHSTPPAGPSAAGGRPQDGQSGSILHRTTRDVVDAKSGRRGGAVKANTKIPVGDPVTVSMSAYKNARFRAAQLQINSGLQAFYAEQGRYPRNYDEFKRDVLDQYNVQLPALPDHQRYGYDAQKRELILLEYPELKNRRH